MSEEQGGVLCQTVSKALTGTFMASVDGFWETHPDFRYSDALYVFEFNNFVGVTEGYFEEFMHTVRKQFIDELQNVSARQAFPYNILLLTNAAKWFTVGDTVQRVRLTGDAAFIFNRADINSYWGLGSMYGVCSPSNGGYVSYDPSGIFSMSLTSSDFSASSRACNYAANVTGMLTVGTKTVYKLDVRSAMLAMAYNLGYFPFELLQPIKPSTIAAEKYKSTSEADKLVFNGIPYDWQLYYDIRNPGMAPIMCWSRYNTSTPPVLCLASSGYIFGLPILSNTDMLFD